VRAGSWDFGSQDGVGGGMNRAGRAAADLARRETGVPWVHLLGVSWGGKLALACAAHRPDLYRSLILAAPKVNSFTSSDAVRPCGALFGHLADGILMVEALSVPLWETGQGARRGDGGSDELLLLQVTKKLTGSWRLEERNP
jgi:pimeloyl-ACP methyl ester carboxylesterase